MQFSVQKRPSHTAMEAFLQEASNPFEIRQKCSCPYRRDVGLSCSDPAKTDLLLDGAKRDEVTYKY